MRSAKPKRSSSPRARSVRGKHRQDQPSESLLGLGPVSMRVLRAAGITTRGDIEKLGPVQAFLAAKRVNPAVTLNLLWGIAGAVTDTHWSKLPTEYRSSLLLEYDGLLDAERAMSAASIASGVRTGERKGAK